VKRFLLLTVTLLLIAPAAFASGAQKAPGVTLDVKDEDVHVILKSMQKQCGIKNLIVDPGVEGKGTFLFHDVPCPTAFDVVLKTMNLGLAEYSADVVEVHRNR
jgi:type II secretory pathway component GspD/PulD (secretin)